MGIAHIMVGICLVKEWFLASFIFILCFQLVFQVSQGNVAHIYTAEVSVDAVAGFGISAQFINMIQITASLEYMMSGFLKVHGTFYFFGIVCLIGAVYCQIFLRETRGLTSAQKKLLYTPLAKVKV